MHPIMSLREIVQQLEMCGFTCEAGPLENNAAFLALERWAAHEVEGLRTVEIDPNGRYIFQSGEPWEAQRMESVRHQLKELFDGETQFVLINGPLCVTRLDG